MLYKSVYRRRHRTAMSGWQPIPHTSQIHITGGHISQQILFFFQLQMIYSSILKSSKNEGYTWRIPFIMSKLFRPLPTQNPITVASKRPYYLFCTSGQTRQKDENSDKAKVNDKENISIGFRLRGNQTQKSFGSSTMLLLLNRAQSRYHFRCNFNRNSLFYATVNIYFVLILIS